MDIGFFGRTLIYTAFAAAIWTSIAPVVGRAWRDRRWIESGTRGLYVTAALVVAATVLLVIGLALRDFSIEYVANYTSFSTPRIYALTALWAGMEGSLLFWTMTTSLFAVTAVHFQRGKRGDLVPIATSVLGGLLAFFLGMIAFGANPFTDLSPIPVDGAGLNPLLQSPFMAIHPVLLYLGFTGFSVPFAFAVSALLAGRLDVRWFTSTRRWTTSAWAFLTAGIVLGAAWAYHELGWGGYWAWDPVENASLLPWLTGTAFLHSVMIQERRGMLKVWNVGLILTTYSLAVFGTFLTRSGLLTSVHTFSESPLGKYFLPFLGVIAVASFALLASRTERLKSQRRLDSVLSREAMFLFNNLLLTALAFTIAWGTLYPVLVEAFAGKKISVGPPYFNSVVIPVGLALLALAGIGPLVAWRKASPRNLRKQFTTPMLAGSAATLGLAVAGVRSAPALAAVGLCVFVASSTLTEFMAAFRAHRSIEGKGAFNAIRATFARNRRRYGGYVVHLGVVLIVFGLSGGAFKQTWSGDVSVGDRFSIGPYDITYADSRVYPTGEKMVMMAVLDVEREGKPVARLLPQRNFHFAQRQPQSEVALVTTITHDLYIVLTQLDQTRTASLRAWINPLVIWIWIGGMVMTGGTVIVLTGKPAGETMTPTRTHELEKVAT